MTGYGAVSQSVHCSGSPWGCQSLKGLPTRCKAENERPPVTWMRPPCGSFVQLSEVDLKCVLFSSIED